jgi:hypothetical protein
LADIHSRKFLARDRKIIELDTNVNRRKLQRELKDLQKSVYNDRRELDNAIRGDKQKLRNTLAEHKQLQLAYQNSQPKVRSYNAKKISNDTFSLNFLMFLDCNRADTSAELHQKKSTRQIKI